MRKALILGLAGVMSVGFAATADAGILRFIGVKGAWSSSGRAADADTEFERRTGVSLGAEAEWQLGNVISLRTDFEYTERGWIMRESGGEAQEETELNYVSVPILFQFSVPAVITRPYVQIGPRIDFLTKINSDTFGDETPDDWKSMLVGGVIAAGAQIQKFYPVVISGTARYNFDFGDLSDLENVKITNNAVDVWVGVGYAFGPRQFGQ